MSWFFLNLCVFRVIFPKKKKKKNTCPTYYLAGPSARKTIFFVALVIYIHIIHENTVKHFNFSALEFI